VIKISEGQQPEEISPEVIKNDDRSQENKKIAAVQWMTHQRIGAAVTKAPFATSALLPHAQARSNCPEVHRVILTALMRVSVNSLPEACGCNPMKAISTSGKVNKRRERRINNMIR